MEKKLTGDDLVAAIEKMDPNQVKNVYYKVIHTMQQRMSMEQQAFK